MGELPEFYRRFLKRFPELGSAYEELGEACRSAGPLDACTAELVKIGMSVSAGLEGATHSHTRRALDAGVSPEEIRHAVLLGIATIGFPRVMAGLAWVEDVLGKRED